MPRKSKKKHQRSSGAAAGVPAAGVQLVASVVDPCSGQVNLQLGAGSADEFVLGALQQQLAKLSTAALSDTGSDHYVDVFYAPLPEFIQVADRVGGEVHQVPIDKFETDHQVKWSEVPQVLDWRKQQILVNQTVAFAHNNSIYEHLLFPTTNLYITKINDQVGHGVFTNRPYKKGEIIAIYTGQIGSTNEYRGFMPYGYICESSGHQETVFSQLFGKAYYDGQTVRNYSSYFQHAPDQKTLDELAIPEDIKQKVFTSNMVAYSMNHLQWPIITMIAIDDLAAGTQLVFDYGSYWQQPAAPDAYALFDTQTNIIGYVNKQGQFSKAEGINIDSANIAPRSNFDQVDAEILMSIRQRKCLQKIAEYLKLNLRLTIEHADKALKAKYSDFFSKLEKLIDTKATHNTLKEAIALHTSILLLFREYNIENNSSFAIIKREFYMFCNRFKTDFINTMQNKIPLETDISRYEFGFLPEELVNVLEKKTGQKWKYSVKQRNFFASSDSKDALLPIKEEFSSVGITAKNFGQAKDGRCFLVFDEQYITIQALLKLKTMKPEVSSTADSGCRIRLDGKVS